MDTDFKELVKVISNEVLKQLKYDKLSFRQSGQDLTLSEEEKLKKIAKMIDHTLLKPDATYDQIKQLCKEAVEFEFASVCINPANVALAVDLLKNTGIPVCSVVGFPLGATTTRSKVFETREAIENGAKEIDMVINITALKSRDYNRVRSDIEEVVIAASGKATVKVIIETCLLTDDEKIRACELAKEAKADFVKTSTGFSSSGATVEDIRLMRKVVGPGMGVKASGGIGDYDKAIALLEAGACTLGKNELCRLGTSKSINIIRHE